MRTKDILVQIFQVFFFGIFYYLLILAIGNMNLQSPLSALAIVPIIFLLYYAVKIRRLTIVNPVRMWYVLQVVSSILMLIIAFQLEVDTSWDWGRLILTSYNYTMTGTVDHLEYFIRYPQQQFWLTCLIALFKVVLKCTNSTAFFVYKAVSMIVSVLVVQLGINMIYRTAKSIWNEQRAFWVGIAALLYVPFYQYALFLYNDTPGACGAALLIYCYVKLRQESNTRKKMIWAVVIGVLGAFVLHIKIITFIVFIALVIDGLLRDKIKMIAMLGGIITFSFIAGYQLMEIPVKAVFQIEEDEVNRYEFPNTHYIMMMLNTSGGFKQEDVDYTWSFDSYEEKKEANIQRIKEQLENRGVLGTIKHLLYTKQIRTWADSCIAGDNYVSRTPIRENSFSQRLFSINGEWHWICLFYTWIVHIMLLVGILLSAVLSFQKKVEGQKMLVGRIAVFGLFLFLTIWECNSRYLFTVVPVIILVASDGIFLLLDKIAENEKEIFDYRIIPTTGIAGGGAAA